MSSAPAVARERRVLIIVTVAIGLVLVAVLASTLSGKDSPAAAPTPSATAPTAIPPGTPTPTATAGPDAAAGAAPVVVRRDPADLMALGDIDAPVVMVEWTDMRCPYCAVFSNRTMPEILTRYVETGKVRIEFRDVAYFGEQSSDAAVAVRAAAEQGSFHAFLTTLFAAAPDSGHADLPRPRLVELARDAGVPDLAVFEAALGRADLHAAVAASTTTAQQLGVSSVPFFVVGNKAVAGAQPLEVFTQLLDEALVAAGA